MLLWAQDADLSGSNLGKDRVRGCVFWNRTWNLNLSYLTLEGVRQGEVTTCPRGISFQAQAILHLWTPPPQTPPSLCPWVAHTAGPSPSGSFVPMGWGAWVVLCVRVFGHVTLRSEGPDKESLGDCHLWVITRPWSWGKQAQRLTPFSLWWERQLGASLTFSFY